MNITLDGYYSGPNCELDWHFERWSRGMGARLQQELLQHDSVLLGRKTYQAMARYWTAKQSDPFCSREDFAFAAMFNGFPKAVFSNTLVEPEWRNSTIMPGRLKTVMNRLRKPVSGLHKGILILGSGQLVTELIRLNLVDEYQLWMHPILLGKGKPLFIAPQMQRPLELIQTEIFSSGVVLLRYKAMAREK